MRNKIKTILFLIFCLSFVAWTVPSAMMAADSEFKITAEKAAADNLGTDTTYIYTFSVDMAGNIASANSYNISYFLDNEPKSQWENQPLPFSFKQNFKGLKDGSYQVRIEVKDNKLNVMAIENITITIKK